MNRRMLRAALGALLCACVSTGCSAAKSAPVRTVGVRYGALRTVLAETGVLQLPNVVTAPATMSGNIARIYVRAGARVRRGQALARLVEIGNAPAQQRVDAQAALAKVALEVRESERSYASDAYLYARQGIARDALLQSRARLQQARIALQEAREHVGLLRNDDTVVRAPLSGVVQSVAQHPGDDARPIEEGDPVTAGQPLFTVAARENFVVSAKIDEQDLFAVKLGQRVLVGGEDLGQSVLGGRVVAIAPVVQRSDDPTSSARRASATIRLDKRLAFLREGMTVDVDIITHDERHVLLVPISAVRHGAHGSRVMLARGERLAPVNVKLGARNDGQVVVRAGLRAGDRIAADPNATPAP